MATAYYKRGDTKPITAQLKQGNGRPVDLSDATDVALLFRQVDGSGTLDGDCEITEATKGKVSFTPDDDDFVAGVYHAEFQVTFADSSVQTIPSDSYIDFVVKADLNPSP